MDVLPIIQQQSVSKNHGKLFAGYFENKLELYNPSNHNYKYKRFFPYSISHDFLTENRLSFIIPRNQLGSLISIDYVLFKGLDLSLDKVKSISLESNDNPIEKIGYETLKLLLDIDPKKKKLLEFFHSQNIFCLHLPFNFVKNKNFYPYKYACYSKIVLKIEFNENINLDDIKPMLYGESMFTDIDLSSDAFVNSKTSMDRFISHISHSDKNKYITDVHTYLHRSFTEHHIDIISNQFSYKYKSTDNCQGYIFKIESTHPNPLKSFHMMDSHNISKRYHSALDSLKTIIQLDLPNLDNNKIVNSTKIYCCYYYYPFSDTFFDYELSGYVLGKLSDIEINFELNIDSGSIILFTQNVQFAIFTNGLYHLY